MTPPPPSVDYGGALQATSAGAAATGRFYFRKKTLSYSIVANEMFGFPKLLTFLDQVRVHSSDLYLKRVTESIKISKT